MKKAVLDLWSGTGSATAPFKDAGFEIINVDIDCKRKATFQMDILDFHTLVMDGGFNTYLLDNDLELVFIWASPDCKLFSMANGSKGDHWHQGHPKSMALYFSLTRIAATIEIIEELDVDYWVLENPRGLLRTVPMMGLIPRRTVSYCQYGDTRMKPTDLWGYIPVAWKPKMCHNGAKCHTPAPRGSNAGTDGMKYNDKIQVPYGLPDSIMHECIKRDWKRARWKDLSDFALETRQVGGGGNY